MDSGLEWGLEGHIQLGPAYIRYIFQGMNLGSRTSVEV